MAVVTSGGRSVAGDVAALMEARLTTVEGVEVLDRAEIDRVLAEQRLSLQGGVAAGQAVRAGRLLKCDLLVVIDGKRSRRHSLQRCGHVLAPPL